MDDIRRSAYEYFHNTSGFSRCFAAMRKKWQSFGRTAGVIRLTDADVEERRALEGFLGRSFTEESIRFSMEEFEKALKETRFGTLNLKELLEIYFEEPLQSNQQRKLQKETQLRTFFEECERGFREDCPSAAHWIRAAWNEKSYGYLILVREWNRSPQQARKLTESAGRALDQLEKLDGQPILLAVLATRVSGNPHFFDRGTVAGQLFVQGLCWRTSGEIPVNAQELWNLYFINGIQMDDISSTVTAFGLHLERDGKLHPAYEGFVQEREPVVIMQKNLERVTRAFGEGDRVYIVENEMVFSHLCQECGGLSVTILCISGQPRKAAWLLLDLLAAEEAVPMYYAGDLDPEGMDIADRIWKRYPEKLQIWRMDPESYAKSMSEEGLDGRRLAMLDRLEHPLLRETAKLLKTQKRAGYQEALLEEMAGDIIEHITKQQRSTMRR